MSEPTTQELIEWLERMSLTGFLRDEEESERLFGAAAERLRAMQAREAELRYTIEQQKQAMQWRPMSEAPRDATAILVMNNIAPGNDSGYADGCVGHNTYVAAWWEGEGWVCYMSMIQEPRCPIEPTHWMPLPPPPKDE